MANRSYSGLFDDFFGSGKPAAGAELRHEDQDPVAMSTRQLEQMQGYLQKRSQELTRELRQDGLLAQPGPAQAAQTAPPPPPKPGYGSWQGVEEALSGQLVGQAEFLKSLARAFRRPTVLGSKGEGCPNVILIQGGPGSGKHTALRQMAAELCARGLLPSGGIAWLDLALYPGPAQEKLFLQDLYAALNAPGQILALEHWSAASPGCRSLLSALVLQGKAPLASRYVLQRGILVESGTALVDHAVSALTPRGKYFVFLGQGGLEQLAACFGGPFSAKVGDVCTLQPYTPEALTTIAAGQLNALAQQAREKLELTLRAGPDLRDWLAEQYHKAAGVAAITQAAGQLTRALAEYKLTREPAPGAQITLAVAEQGPVLTPAEGEAVLAASLLPTGYTGEREAAEAELEAIVGLAPVKDYVHSLADNVAAQARRKAAGLPAAPVSMHMIFAGNPGTGKTTIARITAKYLKAIGALRGGQLVEVTRADLVGRYVGHTAPLTNSVIQSALGGVLFIDEAYSLFRGREDSFGLEAIDTLVKGMEDHRDDLVVVLAGYSREMEQFLQANSGLASRFANRIEFPDYTGAELLAITHSLAKGKGYRLDPACELPLKLYYDRRQAEDARTAGNGRLARNLLEKAMLNQARRLAADPDAPLDLLLPGDWDLEEPEA